LESLGDRLASATEKAQATLVQIEAMQKQRHPALISG
jgi:hypothetical protein